jgi:hypothetical protein
MQRVVISNSITLLVSLLLAVSSSAQVGTQSVQQGEKAWPRGYSTANEAQIVIYQPQIASWEGKNHMVAYAAVAHVAKGEQKPSMGTVKLAVDTSVSVERRLVHFAKVKVIEANFSTLSKEQTREIVSVIEESIPDEDRIISLDRVLVHVEKSQIIPKNVEGLKSDPPKIIISITPAILVSFDGEPIWSPIKDNELKFAVNTNWDVFQHNPTGVYYLRNDSTWLRAANINGPWSPTAKLPESFEKLPADDNWKEVKASLPAKPTTKAPIVYVSAEPAELILIDGPPKLVPVPGTSLSWVSNTESDLLLWDPMVLFSTWWRADGSAPQIAMAIGSLLHQTCQRTFARSRSSILAPAYWRRCPELNKRRRQLYSRRCRRLLALIRRSSKVLMSFIKANHSMSLFRAHNYDAQ